MNTTLRTSLVALLALIPILVTTGCNTSTPGVASPAGTTSSSSSSTAAPAAPNSAPNSVPNSDTTTLPPTEPPTPTETPAPSSPEPSSPEPSAQEPSAQEPVPAGPDVLPTDLSGEVYGFIRAVDVDQSQLTLDKVDWFSGAAAEQACAADAVPQDAHLDGWCSVYYYRNVNPKLRDVSVSPDAVITTLQGTTPVSDDLQTLADRAGSSGGDYHLYRSEVTDGAIVEITQIYQP